MTFYMGVLGRVIKESGEGMYVTWNIPRKNVVSSSVMKKLTRASRNKFSVTNENENENEIHERNMYSSLLELQLYSSYMKSVRPTLSTEDNASSTSLSVS